MPLAVVGAPRESLLIWPNGAALLKERVKVADAVAALDVLDGAEGRSTGLAGTSSTGPAAGAASAAAAVAASATETWRRPCFSAECEAVAEELAESADLAARATTVVARRGHCAPYELEAYTAATVAATPELKTELETVEIAAAAAMSGHAGIAARVVMAESASLAARAVLAESPGLAARAAELEAYSAATAGAALAVRATVAKNRGLTARAAAAVISIDIGQRYPLARPAQWSAGELREALLEASPNVLLEGGTEAAVNTELQDVETAESAAAVGAAEADVGDTSADANADEATVVIAEELFEVRIARNIGCSSRTNAAQHERTHNKVYNIFENHVHPDFVFFRTFPRLPSTSLRGTLVLCSLFLFHIFAIWRCSVERCGARETSRYGLRSLRIGEASHPGPRRLDLRRGDGTMAILSCSSSWPAWARGGCQYFKWQLTSDPRQPGPMRRSPKEALESWLLKHRDVVHRDSLAALSVWEDDSGPDDSTPGDVASSHVAPRASSAPASRQRPTAAAPASAAPAAAAAAAAAAAPATPELPSPSSAPAALRPPPANDQSGDAPVPPPIPPPPVPAPAVASAAVDAVDMPLPPPPPAPSPAAAPAMAPDAAGSPSWETFLPCLDAVDLRREILHPVRFIRDVPAEHVEAFLSILERTCGLIAQAASGRDELKLRRSERLLQLLPKLLLTAPPTPQQTTSVEPLGQAARNAARVASSLQRFHVGDWHALLSDAKRDWPLARTNACAAGPDADNDDAIRKLMDKVLSLVAEGEIGRAAHLLQSNGLADATDATADALRPMLCPNPRQKPPDRSWVDKRKDIAAGISKRPLLRVLRKAAKGGACDLAGWYYEHLQLALGRKSTFEAITKVCNLIAQGSLSEEFYTIAALGRVTPLRKGLKNKLRPLVCGSTWRRLTMSALCNAHKETFRDHLGSEQYAVGVKAALEKLSATLSVLLHLHPDAAVIQVDAISAFNHMLREAMLEEIEACCPQLLTIFSQWLARESTVVMFTLDGRLVEFKTGVGVDQGCPGSPVAFAFGMRRALQRIRARVQVWFDQSTDSALRGAYLAILSYLDDLSLVIPPAAVERAVPIVQSELRAVGLDMNSDKSLCWAPSGRCPPGQLARQLWENASRHDGMVLCGCPFEGVLTIDEADDVDTDTAMPVGAPDFIDAFLSKYRAKVADLVGHIVEIPAKCSPGRLAVQSANLLLRFCCSQKATHLTRLLPPHQVRTLAIFIDNTLMDGFCRLNGLEGLETWQRTAVTMPLSRGGCGFRPLTCACEAAFVGSWVQCAPHVAAITGEELKDDANPVFADVHQAILDLRELYGVDALQTLGISWHDVVTVGREKAQRDLSQAVTGFLYKGWYQTVPPLDKTAVDSGAAGEQAPGAGDWLLACPRTKSTSIPDAAYRCILRARLRCDLVPSGARCAYRIQRTQRICTKEVLGPADHAHACCDLKVNARHNALRDKWCQLYRQAGYHAATEQSVPELGPGQAVEADIRAEGGPAEPVRYADVVVTHPIQIRNGRLAGSGPGVAAAREERGKLNDYRPRPGGRPVLLVPLAFESFGRWGKSAALELRRLARRRSEMLDAARSVDPTSVYRGCLRRWRQEISVALQLSNFAIYSACAQGLRPMDFTHCPHDDAGALAGLIVEGA